MGILIQEGLDIFDAGHAVSVVVFHFFDLDGNRLRLLTFAITLVVFKKCELFAGDGGAIVAGGYKLFETEFVEIGGEILEEIALEGIVAVAINGCISDI